MIRAIGDAENLHQSTSPVGNRGMKPFALTVRSATSLPTGVSVLRTRRAGWSA